MTTQIQCHHCTFQFDLEENDGKCPNCGQETPMVG